MIFKSLKTRIFLKTVTSNSNSQSKDDNSLMVYRTTSIFHMSVIDLQGNNLTVIFDADFEDLSSLRILQLMDNNIHTIEKNAFQDLVALERLRLNNNQLRHIPDLLLSNLPHLITSQKPDTHCEFPVQSS
ncbi:hypothetical protein M8J76_008470 [Diaphorina citri]|nr:hypothetical protein M8J76_008470 [Diaphorina citri]